MSDNPRHALGRDAEKRACRWLEAKGLSLVCANWRGRRGELDLVMRDGPVLAVVEVRARAGRTHEDAMFSVGPAKVRRLSAALREYLFVSGLGDSMPVRFDIVTVAGDPLQPSLRWWRDAVRVGRLY